MIYLSSLSVQQLHGATTASRSKRKRRRVQNNLAKAELRWQNDPDLGVVLNDIAAVLTDTEATTP